MKISVIVPVYNVENYLQTCVDSIISSTYTDLEVILVDDGSTDTSGHICDEAAAHDQRVKVLHIDNGGVANARNLGVKQASGEFITFVDADDVISPAMLRLLLEAIELGDHCDFSMARAASFQDGSGPQLDMVMDAPLVTTVCSQEQYMGHLFRDNRFGYPVVWAKLFRRDFIDKVTFKDIAAEDIEWMTRLCVKMNQAVIVERRLYGYRVRPESITHDNDSVNATIVSRLNTYMTCLNDIPQELSMYRSWCLLYTYKMMLNTRHNARDTRFQQEVMSISSSIYDQTIDELKYSQLNWLVKACLQSFYHQPWLYAIIYSVYAKLYSLTHR